MNEKKNCPYCKKEIMENERIFHSAYSVFHWECYQKALQDFHFTLIELSECCLTEVVSVMTDPGSRDYPAEYDAGCPDCESLCNSMYFTDADIEIECRKRGIEIFSYR